MTVRTLTHTHTHTHTREIKRSSTHSFRVPGFFEDLPGRLELLAFLAAFQDAHLLLHAHAQTLHHLRTQDANQTHVSEVKYTPGFTVTCSKHTDTHLFSGAGDEALVQPESLFLRETMSLVVPKQGALDLSHTHTHTHIRKTNKKRLECRRRRVIRRLRRVLIPRNKKGMSYLFSRVP